MECICDFFLLCCKTYWNVWEIKNVENFWIFCFEPKILKFLVSLNVKWSYSGRFGNRRECCDYTCERAKPVFFSRTYDFVFSHTYTSSTNQSVDQLWRHFCYDVNLTMMSFACVLSRLIINAKLRFVEHFLPYSMLFRRKSWILISIFEKK